MNWTELNKSTQWIKIETRNQSHEKEKEKEKPAHPLRPLEESREEKEKEKKNDENEIHRIESGGCDFRQGPQRLVAVLVVKVDSPFTIQRCVPLQSQINIIITCYSFLKFLFNFQQHGPLGTLLMFWHTNYLNNHNVFRYVIDKIISIMLT